MKKFLSLIMVIAMAAFFAGCQASDLTEEAERGVQMESFDETDVSEEALAYAESVIEEDGVYTTPAMVAAYLYTYNKLPSNFITKKEAQKLGWVSKEGNLNDVAPGKSIGGDYFGNHENKLPSDGKYHECDVNYESGRRGGERIIYSSSYNIYYTNDHYNSFTQLY